MTENERDAGLVRGVGPWGLAASIVNALVGAGIFVVPAALAASVGAYAPLAFLVCAVAVGAVALCFAEAGSRVPTSGGVYGAIEAAFGPRAGYVAGTLLYGSNALACGGIAAALGDAIADLAPAPLRAGARVAGIVVVLGGIVLVNTGGVGRGVSLVRVATAVKLVPLAIFLVVGAGAVRAEGFGTPAALDTGGAGRALILALFALTGMEGPLGASGEVARPSRTIPRAIGGALISVTLLYVGIQLVAQGVLGPALATSKAPLVEAMARVGALPRLVLLAGAALSMFGWICSDLLGTPRVLFALARDGLLPRWLGRVHARTGAPYAAIVAYAAIAAGLALTGTFAELAVLSTLATTPIYIAGCAAAWRLARRGVARAGEPLGSRVVAPAAVVGVVSMGAMIALASRLEIAALAAAIAASLAAYRVVRWRARAR